MSKSPLLPVSIILILNLGLVVVATNSFTKTCYAPDGTPSGDDFLPCIMTGNVDGSEFLPGLPLCPTNLIIVFSVCCGTNRTSNLGECLTNGLCLNVESGDYFFDYCTDPTWQSPNCLPKDTCTNSTTGGLASLYVEMTQCSDGSWCCGSNNFTDCCTPELGFHLKDNLVTFDTPNATTAACIASPVVTLTTTATATATVTTQSKDGSKIAGVVVGFSFLAIFGSFGGFYIGLMRGQRMGGNRIDTACKVIVCKPPRVGAHEAHGIAISELGDNYVRKPR